MLKDLTSVRRYTVRCSLCFSACTHTTSSPTVTNPHSSPLLSPAPSLFTDLEAADEALPEILEQWPIDRLHTYTQHHTSSDFSLSSPSTLHSTLLMLLLL